MKKEQNIVTNYVVPAIGLLGLIALVIFAFYNPYPSTYQSGVYWIAISLAAAACAVAIPGFFEFRYKGIVRATGAIAVFCLMFFAVPKIMDKDLGPKFKKLSLFVAKDDTAKVQTLSVDFDPNKSSNFCEFTKEALKRYYGASSVQDTFVNYRKSDGRIYDGESCQDIKELDVIMISQSLMPFYKDRKAAYDHVLGLIK